MLSWKQVQIPCLVDQNPARPASKATYENIVVYLSLSNGFGFFVYSCGQRKWLDSFSKLILSAMATTFNLKLFQPRISRSARSLKAAKAEKCENNLHMLSLLLAGPVLKIAANMVSAEELKRRSVCQLKVAGLKNKERPVECASNQHLSSTILEFWRSTGLGNNRNACVTSIL